MKHKLMDLPYAADALAPHISAETLQYHHGKHHQKYVDNLNDLIKDSEYADQSLEEIIGSAGDGPLFNNAAQVWNHNFYWQSLSPNGGGDPEGELASALQSSFGSMDDFRKAFNNEAANLFGSGWVWLINDGSGVISVEATKDAANPLAHGRIALLTCDIWEHAFYIDYRNDKAAYLKAFWQLVNWDFAAERLRTV